MSSTFQNYCISRVICILFRLSIKVRSKFAPGGFLIQNKFRTDLTICMSAAGCADPYGNLPRVCLNFSFFIIYTGGELSLTTKLFQIELRQLIGFISFINDSNCNT